MASLEEVAAASKASQGKEELLWLLEIVDRIKPRIIVELGVHLGHSLKVWQDAFKPELLVGIDHETNDILKAYINTNTLNAAIILGDSHQPETVKSLNEILDGREIDFLFVDGDHMYEGVKKDFQMYAPLVRKGGLIAFDDMDLFDNPSVEVFQFWQEVIKRWPYESMHVDSNGIGIIHV